MRRTLMRLRNGKPYVKSYSQLGEDAAVFYLFKKIHIQRPTYIDIGANDPERFNNTALLYETGSRGVNIEPDPAVFRELASVRTHDCNLNIGIAAQEGNADFYLCTDDKLSTFSKEEADRVVRESPTLSFTLVQIPTLTIGTVIDKYCGGVFPDFLSLDAEGFDKMILESIDYATSAPKVMCVETIRFSDDVESFLASKGYFVFSKSFLNTIFCKKDLWDNR